MKPDRISPIDESKEAKQSLLGRRLRAARIRAGLSQAQLGQLLNVTQAGVSLYEAGARGIGPDVLWECARILNRPLSYFFDESDDGFRFPCDSEIARMVEDLERHREDIAELWLYLAFLRHPGPDTPRPS